MLMQALAASPMAPIDHPPHGVTCSIYTPKLFTTPHPQYITISEVDKRFSQIVCGQVTGRTSTSLDSLVAEASAELPDFKRPSHVSPIGFFEQGIITGLTMALTTIVGVLGMSAYFLFRSFQASSL